MSGTFPYYYRAYGLNVASEIRVTGFESSVESTPDVEIKLGPVPENLDHIVNTGVLFQSNDHEFLFKVDAVAAFYIQNGITITINPNPAATDTEISAFLIGTSFGALLHQRRMLPLHASTVIFKNKCLMFMGVSGSGKTTMATALIKEGAALVADDISVVDFSGEKPAIRPAFPAVKIWKDSLKHLGIDDKHLIRIRGELEKFYLPVDRFDNTLHNIDRIFVLNTYNKSEAFIKPLEGIQKFQVVKRHTYLFRGIPRTGLETNHFQLAGELIRQVPVYLLTRSNAGFNIADLTHVIKNAILSHE